ncbi:MAG: lipid-A-disaccharide synthase [bacterium]
MRYFIIAGEASGDLHGSNLITAIRERDKKAEFIFLGGDLMSKAACSAPLVHYREMAFMGFINVIAHLPQIITNGKKAQKALLEFVPDKVILIDYPGFNLKFAKFVKQNLPTAEINYYIAPKLWVWKEYRIKKIKRNIDKMYTIFPFETNYFNKLGYNVTYVGNPTVESVTKFKSEPFNKEEFLENNNLESKPIIALLSGSRKQEIRSCLPTMAQLAEQFTDYQFVVAAAPGIAPEYYKNLTTNNVSIVYENTYALLSVAQYAIVNSGTATLETALFQVPQVVVYNVFGGRLAMLLKSIFIKTKFVSLVNIIAQKEVVKELLAHNFTLENMTKELQKIITSENYKNKMITNYQSIAAELGESNAAKKIAFFLCDGATKTT